MKLILENIDIPSVNHYWKACNHRRYISKRGIDFKLILSTKAIKSGFKPITGNVQVNIIWHCSKKGRGDLDNKFKAILDSLKGIAYHDDDQVMKICAEKKQHTGFSALEVEVLAI